MIRRMTLSTLTVALAVLMLVGPPAAAKGPSEVKVHDLRTGTTTLLDQDRTETWALMQLVEWPDGAAEPRGISTGRLELIATLTWQFPHEIHGSPVWLDSVYADSNGATWVQRRDHLSEPAVTTWGRVRAGFALEAVLAGLEEPAKVPTTSHDKTATVVAPASPGVGSGGGWDGASFGWGAGSAGALAGLLFLGARWWRQRSVTASRKSRVSMPAAS